MAEQARSAGRGLRRIGPMVHGNRAQTGIRVVGAVGCRWVAGSACTAGL